MQVNLNGQSHQLPVGATIADLLETLNLSPRQVAVEVNLQLVPRTLHAEHLLQEGDQLEVVTLVGGG